MHNNVHDILNDCLPLERGGEGDRLRPILCSLWRPPFQIPLAAVRGTVVHTTHAQTRTFD